MKRSPLFYVGDKAQLIEIIISLVPEKINNYYEPFLGGGTVAMNVTAKKYVLSDCSKDLIAVHESISKTTSLSKIKAIINKYGLYSYDNLTISDYKLKKIKDKYPKTYYANINKKPFLELRNRFNETKNSLELYVLIIYSFNRMIRFNSKGEYNVPVGNLIFNQKVEKCLLDYRKFVHDNIINFSCKDYKYLYDVSFNEDDFVYLDPPYLITNAEYNKSWSETDEEQLYDLLDYLNKKGVKFMLSNVYQYQGKINNHMNRLQKYNFYKVESNYINKNNNKKKDIIELIVTNY